MTRFWLTLVTVVLMLVLPLFAPAEHRGVAAMIIWAIGLAAVSCLAWPSPADSAEDKTDSQAKYATHVAKIAILESQLNGYRQDLARAREEKTIVNTKITLGDDPRIETVYGSAAVDRAAGRDYAGRPQLVDHRHTQSEDVVSRWVREGRKTWASTALRTNDGLYFLRDGAPVNLISKLEQ